MPTRYRFDADDILYNKVRTYPKTEAYFYQGNIYLDNQAHSGSNANHPNGHVNLYALNALEVSASEVMISPSQSLYQNYQQYIHKTPNGLKFKSITTASYNDDYAFGDKMFVNMPFTSTFKGIHYSTQSYANGKIAVLPGFKQMAFIFLARDHFFPNELAVRADTKQVQSFTNFQFLADIDANGLLEQRNILKGKNIKITDTEYVRKKLFGLKNIINSYEMASPHFQYSSSLEPVNRNLETSELTIINIPSIFYGEKINEGSVRLKYYQTGTLAGIAEDTLQNGELIHTGPGSRTYGHDSEVSGTVVGLVLYNEGIIILSSSVDIHPSREVFRPGLGGFGNDGTEAPKWINFASTIWTGSSTPRSTWGLEFEGVNHIPTLTMYAHARRGHINHSNNPSFINFDDVYQSDPLNYVTGAYGLRENKERRFYNFVSSSYKQSRIMNDPLTMTDGTSNIFPEFSASFKKQVYISKVGVYDDDNNLIAVAKLAQPFRKEEADSISFKLKLDL